MPRFPQSLDRSELLRAYENNNSGSVQQTRAEIVYPEVARVDVPSHLACAWVVTLGPVSIPARRSSRIPVNRLAGDEPWVPQIITDGLGIIEWSAGRQGASQFAQVDWTVGQCFSLFASSIVVRGGVTAWAADSPPSEIQSFSAHIVPGVVIRKAIRTVRYLDLAIGQEEILAVPPFAERVSFSSSASTASGDATLTGEDGSAIVWTSLPVGLVPADEILMPMGTNFIRITANSLGGLVQPRLRYELALS